MIQMIQVADNRGMDLYGLIECVESNWSLHP
jgi:hypothetical protein